jgi:hypothetical protein
VTAAKKKPPAAGKGRVKGKPNKVTGSVREMFAAFVEGNVPKVQGLFDRVAKKNPIKALEIMVRFAEFVVPRLQRTEGGGGAVNFNLFAGSGPITVADAESAERVYREICANPKFDFSQVTWATPAPTETIEQPISTVPSPAPEVEYVAPPAQPYIAGDPASNVTSIDAAKAARDALWIKLGQ